MHFKEGTKCEKSLKEKLSRWYGLPIELLTKEGIVKSVQLSFESYTEDEIVTFFNRYLVSGLENSFLAIRMEGISKDTYAKLPFDAVLYFEAVQEKLYAYTEKSAYMIKSKLYELEDIHPSFVRIGKSYVVNILAVKKIRPTLNNKLAIVLRDNQELEVSRKYRKSFLEYLEAK